MQPYWSAVRVTRLEEKEIGEGGVIWGMEEIMRDFPTRSGGTITFLPKGVGLFSNPSNSHPLSPLPSINHQEIGEIGETGSKVNFLLEVEGQEGVGLVGRALRGEVSRDLPGREGGQEVEHQ